MEFEVAAIYPDPGGETTSNIPLGEGDEYVADASHFRADGRLAMFIEFAYKWHPTGEQRQAYLAHVPEWVSSENFVIDARAPGTPTKDQVRLMMQSLLADRFHLVLHFEERTGSVLALVLAKPGVTGRKLRPHSEGPPCPEGKDLGTAKAQGDVFPPGCQLKIEWADHWILRAGSRDTTMDFIARNLQVLGHLGRPVIDETGLNGTYDFTLDWAPDMNSSSSPVPNDEVLVGSSFAEALKDQLGLKLKPTKAPIRMLVIDHIEKPTEN